VLPGITRKVVINLAQGVFDVEERDITVEELRTADEAFLTASFKEVVPIVKIDDDNVGDGRIGEVSKKVLELFSDFTQNY
jgi:branched-chain amino acid aminotransferase